MALSQPVKTTSEGLEESRLSNKESLSLAAHRPPEDREGQKLRQGRRLAENRCTLSTRLTPTNESTSAPAPTPKKNKRQIPQRTLVCRSGLAAKNAASLEQTIRCQLGCPLHGSCSCSNKATPPPAPPTLKCKAVI